MLQRDAADETVSVEVLQASKDRFAKEILDISQEIDKKVAIMVDNVKILESYDELIKDLPEAIDRKKTNILEMEEQLLNLSNSYISLVENFSIASCRNP